MNLYHENDNSYSKYLPQIVHFPGPELHQQL